MRKIIRDDVELLDTFLKFPYYKFNSFFFFLQKKNPLDCQCEGFNSYPAKLLSFTSSPFTAYRQKILLLSSSCGEEKNRYHSKGEN